MRLATPPHRDAAPRRPSAAALLELVERRSCAGRALLLESDYTPLTAEGRWHDKLSGRVEPFERALARARKDALGGRLERFARLVDHDEAELLRADGWTPTPTEHGVVWRQPDADGTPRTLVEAAAVVIARTLAAVRDPGPPLEGLRVERECQCQCEGQGDDVAQAPAPDDVAQPPAPDGEELPAWLDEPEGFAAVEGAWPVREALGGSVHGDDVAPPGAEGMPG